MAVNARSQSKSSRSNSGTLRISAISSKKTLAIHPRLLVRIDARDQHNVARIATTPTGRPVRAILSAPFGILGSGWCSVLLPIDKTPKWEEAAANRRIRGGIGCDRGCRISGQFCKRSRRRRSRGQAADRDGRRAETPASCTRSSLDKPHARAHHPDKRAPTAPARSEATSRPTPRSPTRHRATP